MNGRWFRVRMNGFVSRRTASSFPMNVLSDLPAVHGFCCRFSLNDRMFRIEPFYLRRKWFRIRRWVMYYHLIQFTAFPSTAVSSLPHHSCSHLPRIKGLWESKCFGESEDSRVEDMFSKASGSCIEGCCTECRKHMKGEVVEIEEADDIWIFDSISNRRCAVTRGIWFDCAKASILFRTFDFRRCKISCAKEKSLVLFLRYAQCSCFGSGTKFMIKLQVS